MCIRDSVGLDVEKVVVLEVLKVVFVLLVVLVVLVVLVDLEVLVDLVVLLAVPVPQKSILFHNHLILVWFKVEDMDQNPQRSLSIF